MVKRGKSALLIQFIRWVMMHLPSKTKKFLSMAFPMMIISFLIHYRRVLKMLVLHAGERSAKIIKKMPTVVANKFYVSPFFFSSYAQCFIGTKRLNPNKDLIHIIEMFDFPNGGKCILDWYSFKTRSVNYHPEVIVMVVPGTNTPSNSNYLEDLAVDLLNNNYQAVLFSPRVNQERFHAPTEGYWDTLKDLHDAIEHVRTKQPGHKIMLVGHSYGGNTVCNYLARYSENPGVMGGISLANPFDIATVSNRILGTLIDKWLMKGIIIKAQLHREYLETIKDKFMFNVDAIVGAKSFQTFEREFIMKAMGFKDLVEYYDGTSSSKILTKIKHPCLLVNSLDDPFIDRKILPMNIHNENPNVILVLTQKGGHLGWVEGIIKQNRWSTRVILEYISAVRTTA